MLEWLCSRNLELAAHTPTFLVSPLEILYFQSLVNTTDFQENGCYSGPDSKQEYPAVAHRLVRAMAMAPMRFSLRGHLLQGGVDKNPLAPNSLPYQQPQNSENSGRGLEPCPGALCINSSNVSPKPPNRPLGDDELQAPSVNG
jgi:hypothetical protein